MLVSLCPCQFRSATQFEVIFVGDSDTGVDLVFAHLVDVIVIQAGS
jgi:hypothetical protein